MVRISLALAVALTLSAFSTSAKEQLPFPDGRYVTDPGLCGISESEIVYRLGDGAGINVREFDGPHIANAYDMDCTIQDVSIVRRDVRFTALCEQEGEENMVNGHYVATGSDSFRLGRREFTRCSEASAANESEEFGDGILATTEEIVNVWQDANDKCRGGNPGDIRMHGACGAREEYSRILTERGWCWGHEGQPEASYEWHRCESTSVR